MSQHVWHRTIIITLFAIAMGFLESSVVVYLRAIYYPEGFEFPLQPLGSHMVLVEIIREAATIVMLVTVAMLAARHWIVRFAWFIYLFAIWDIFYYVFLWALLGWPESLFTWDVLFLIPTTWVGPVLAPVINSLTMIWLAGVILAADRRRGGTEGAGVKVRLSGVEWGFLVAGSILTIGAYIQDYTTYMLSKFTFGEWHSFYSNPDVLMHVARYEPTRFNWLVFTGGTVLFLVAIWLFRKRSLKVK